MSDSGRVPLVFGGPMATLPEAAAPKPGTTRYAETRGVLALLDDVCERNHVTTAELMRGGNRRSICAARAEASYELRQRGFTWDEIGRLLNCHLSSALKAVGKFEKRMGARSK